MLSDTVLHYYTVSTPPLLLLLRLTIDLCLQSAEAKFFRNIIPQYYEHHIQHPDSLLIRFCGMYMVKAGHRKIPFIVMEW